MSHYPCSQEESGDTIAMERKRLSVADKMKQSQQIRGQSILILPEMEAIEIVLEIAENQS